MSNERDIDYPPEFETDLDEWMRQIWDAHKQAEEAEEQDE